MAIIVAGYVFDEKTAPTGKMAGWVHPYFLNANPSSTATSQWSKTPYQVSAGYFSIDIKGANFLTADQSITCNPGDKLYLVFYRNENKPILDDKDRASSGITIAAFYEFTLTNDTFTQGSTINVTAMATKSPIFNTNVFPVTELLTKHDYTMSETSKIDTSFYYGTGFDNAVKDSRTTQTKQAYTTGTEIIFDGHQLIDTEYTWDSSTIKYGVDANKQTHTTSSTHNYTVAGVYTLKIKAREKWGTFKELTKSVNVRYNVPVIDFNWNPTSTNSNEGTPKIKGQELITFTNISTDLDNRTATTYTYDWTITDKLQDGSDNTSTYTSKDKAFKPSKAFQSAGVKTITLVCKWYDGVDPAVKTITTVHTLEVFPFVIVPNFNWSPSVIINRGQEVTFNPDLTTLDTNKISNYLWNIQDSYPASATDIRTFTLAETSKFSEGSSNPSVVVANNKVINTQYAKHKFHSVLDSTVKVTITYNDGWKDVIATKTLTVTKQKYSITPLITATTLAPQGRDVEVTFTDATVDTNSLQYTVDWSIEDMYSVMNYDNPHKGTTVTDNSNSYLDQLPTVKPKHKFQSPTDHNIQLTIRYDDGWQEQTKRTTVTVTPIVYPAPTPDISWTPDRPNSRKVEVTFSNVSIDTNNRSTFTDWSISDTYDKDNYDNPTFGTDKDNSNTYLRQTVDYQPKHKFQTWLSNNIDFTLYYDDGFQERTVQKTEIINPLLRARLVPNFSISNASPMGRAEKVIFTDTTVDTNGFTHLSTWNISDKFSLLNYDNPEKYISEKDNSDTHTLVLSTFKPEHYYQSPVAHNVNLLITWDDGWKEDTETIAKTVTPVVFPAPTPDISWTPIVPNNRHTEVTFSNKSTDTNNRLTFTDWKINDFYDAMNIDNPTLGTVKDNTFEYDRQTTVFKPLHKFQTWTSNDIEFTGYYDDGFEEKTVQKTEVITGAILQPAPTPDIDWSPKNPISRDVKVTFSNLTIDALNRHRGTDWTISDSYGKYNPDNTEYGVSDKDNTKSYLYQAQTYQPEHYFQSFGSHNIKLKYYYDDGWVERSVEKTEAVITNKYILNASYITSPEAVNRGFVGKTNVYYINNTIDTNNRQLQLDWKINDVKLDGSSDIYDFSMEPDEILGYTYKYPSRTPYTAVNGSIGPNVNKDVKLTVTYDNGWEDVVTTEVSHKFEAVTYEIEAPDINIDYNV